MLAALSDNLGHPVAHPAPPAQRDNEFSPGCCDEIPWLALGLEQKAAGREP